MVGFQFLSRNSVRWDLKYQERSSPPCKFQFLSRNSVRWDPFPRFVFCLKAIVSIPQSEFCPLGPREGNPDAQIIAIVSIPQSEFCPLGPTIVASWMLPAAIVSIPQSEFCPLGRDDRRGLITPQPAFQFLSRNSVRWD